MSTLTMETLPVITWKSVADTRHPVGMWHCMTTGILWLWGEDEEG
jgi:hypothetical protein